MNDSYRALLCSMVNSYIRRCGYHLLIVSVTILVSHSYLFSEDVAEYVQDSDVYTNSSPRIYIKIGGDITEFDMRNYIKDFNKCYIIEISYTDSRYGEITQVIRYRPFHKWNYVKTRSMVSTKENINSRREVKTNVFGRVMDVKIDLTKEVVLSSTKEHTSPENRSTEPNRFSVHVGQISCPEYVNKFDITKVFERRDSFLNHYELYAFHSGFIELPTKESIIERAIEKNDYQIINPSELKFIQDNTEEQADQ